MGRVGQRPKLPKVEQLPPPEEVDQLLEKDKRWRPHVLLLPLEALPQKPVELLAEVLEEEPVEGHPLVLLRAEDVLPPALFRHVVPGPFEARHHQKMPPQREPGDLLLQGLRELLLEQEGVLVYVSVG